MGVSGRNLNPLSSEAGYDQGPAAQDEVIRLLSRPETFGPDNGGSDNAPVEKIETHISRIFICGERVLKLKRAVRYPYLDFSTPEKRKFFCEAEVATNRRTAPDYYHGVVPVTRTIDGALTLGGAGVAVDWVVDMKRFDQQTLFDKMALDGKLTPELMRSLADKIVQFHAGAEVCPNGGGQAGVAATIASDARSFAECSEGIFDPKKVKSLFDQLNQMLATLAPHLEERRKAGLVRHCHGDLHLRNIFLSGGVPTLFDAIEFNENISVIDVMYDLAFLLMDLDHRHFRSLANVVLNRTLDMNGDTAGLSVLPLFMAMRAEIRAHVDAAASMRVVDQDEARSNEAEARAYLDLALDYISPPKPRLIAIGGLSGSGKSTLAKAIAPTLGAPPGARLARTDVLRKRLAGVAPEAVLGPTGYTREMTARTYDKLYNEARTALKAGYSVIVDGVFADLKERAMIARIASNAGVEFDGLWLDVPVSILRSRILGRKKGASDANIEILEQQLGYDPGNINWQRIDNQGSVEKTVAAVANTWSVSEYNRRENDAD